MKIKLKEISIREVAEGYVNNEEEGVIAFQGKLNIRPKYQREFIYKDKQKDAVVESVMKDFPINVMYWVKNQEGIFEVLDGQQRTISICEYIVGNFSIKVDNKSIRYFHSLSDDDQKQILDYKLMVYHCEGNENEILEWFKIINIVGVKLTDQELRNALYTGNWLTDAKKHFSMTNCPAFHLGSKYLDGIPIRQKYLETVIKWISDGHIEEYMSKHHHDKNAEELWQYYQDLIKWVKLVFPNYRSLMKGIEWGVLYNEFKNLTFDSAKLELEIQKYIEDKDVTKNKGIYPYVLTQKESFLQVRLFSPKDKEAAYERQNGICIKCEKYFKFEDMQADHIKPWCEGGKTIASNCQVLCKEDNRTKSRN